MNIRKNIDYSEMHEALDILMQKSLPQMELYCEIGKAVCRRTEKGAAVMASEYLNEKYPDVKGFSPRSLRRMRDFYRTYENHPVLLSRALKLGWIQNVVIMEADLTMELREWYIRATVQFNWTKLQLIEKIAVSAHKEIVLDIRQDMYDNTEKSKGRNVPRTSSKNWMQICMLFFLCIKYRVRLQKGIVQCNRMWLPVFRDKRIAHMRC